MNLSIIYFVFIFLFLLLVTGSIELINHCPTSRRLLLVNSLKIPLGEKKSVRRSIKHRSSMIYIRPQTSQELGRKVRSYTHLLKSKLFTNAEKLQLKRSKKFEKKARLKPKNSIEHMKRKDLITTNNQQEIDRCRSILQIEIRPKINENKPKKTKRNISILNQLKNVTNQLLKNVKIKVNNESTISSKVKSTQKINQMKMKDKQSSKSSTSQSTDNVKYEPETITIIEQIHSPFDEQNRSAVNRAFYFVRNMFQLSEHSSDDNQQHKNFNINNKQNEQEHQTTHRHSRKLLSFDEYHHHSTLFNMSKHRLIANKSKLTKKNDMKTNELDNTAVNKPKVGWTYRISRYQAARKAKKKRVNRERKFNQSIAKRKLHNEEENNSNEISDQNIINSVMIMSEFVPKRQLLTAKSKMNNDINVEKKKNTKRIDPIAIVSTNEQRSQKPHVAWKFRYRTSKNIDSVRQNNHDNQQRLKSNVQTRKPKRKVNKSNVLQTIENKKSQDEQQHEENRRKLSDHYQIDLDPELAQITEQGRKVGWKYRYRIGRKLDHLKQMQAATGVEFDLTTLNDKHEQKLNATKVKSMPKKTNQTIEIIKPTENKKAVGWEYRYRVRRKFDAVQQPPFINQNGKRKKKSTKTTQQTNDLPVTSIFYTIISTATRSICFLPMPAMFSFCQSDLNASIQSKKSKRIKRLRTKKEYRAKQFIRGHHTKLGAEDKATERRVDEQMKKMYKKPSYPPLQLPPTPPPNKDNDVHSSKSNERIEKIIAVNSKKNRNKKKYQIIGKEIKVKPKHVSSSTKQTTNVSMITTTNIPMITITTTSIPFRTLSEVVKQEAETILKTNRKNSQTLEEIQYEINEAKEIIREQNSLKILKPTDEYNQLTSSNDSQDSHNIPNIK